MKATVKQLTTGAFLAILLLIGTTNAKATELEIAKTNSETELEIVETNSETEPDIKIWRIDENIWNNKSFMNYEIVIEAEPSLELENWMTSETTWSSTMNIIEELETELMVEDWMTSESVWNSTEDVIEETESQLTVENWMVSDNVWNKE